MASKTVISIDEKVEATAKLTDFCCKEVVYITLGNVQMFLDKETANQLQEQLEKVVVEKCYQYKSMQEELDRLQQENEDLKEALDNIEYQEAV